jgi:glycolate oxidase FAD binding subunit
VTTAVESVTSALEALAGESHLIRESAVCEALAVGGKLPQFVVDPITAEAVAAVLKFAADHELGVIPVGSGSKLALGNPPRRYDLALSLKQLNHVWHYEPADLTITVEAGMKLADLQEFLGREGLWLPLDPRGGASATIGGILATNSAGPLRLRFGSARDMVLGIKVATTEGKLIRSGGRVVKNVAGYDLCKLLVGSYGTLGVIVEASLKLFPRPAGRATWVLEAGTLGQARELRRSILNSPLEPLRMVLLNGLAAGLVQNGSDSGDGHGLEFWIEVGGSPKILERHARDLVELGRSVGIHNRCVGEPTAENCWHRLINFEQMFAGFSPMILKATLPMASCEQFLSVAQQGAEGEEVKMAGIAQTGIGIVHLGLFGGKLETVADRLVSNTRKAAEGLGGALVVEQYPKGFTGEWDVWGSPGDAFEAMRGLKAAWDPKGILSPGRFVGGI